jgi:hypothetical protein
MEVTNLLIICFASIVDTMPRVNNLMIEVCMHHWMEMRSLLFRLPFLGVDLLWFKAATTKQNQRNRVSLKRPIAG